MLFDRNLEDSGMSQAQHGTRGRPDPINLLPEEIFIKIIRLSINADTPVRDIVKLTAVCRLWKRILEEAPTLWTGVTAAEGLEGIRRALRMVQDAPLDLKFDSSTSAVDLETFFQEMGSKISQWKTLFVDASGGSQVVSSTCPASTTPPTLEVLRLIYSYPAVQVGHEIDLFGGQPAPASLKDVQLVRVPVAFAPLRLSGLTSLMLDNLPNVRVEEIIRILEESPALESLRLSFWHHSNSMDRFSGSANASQDGSICLTSLRSLSIDHVPAADIRLLLSVLRYPNLELFNLRGTIQEDPISDFFAIDTRHLIHVLKRITSAADRIHFKIVGGTCLVIFSNGSYIAWRDRPSVRFQPIRAFFEWLFTHLGARLKEIPVTFSLRGCPSSLPLMEWVSFNLKVTELTLYGSHSATAADPLNVIPFLSSPVSVELATSPSQWLFPYLEVFCSHCTRPLDVTNIAGMVQERHSAIGNQDIPGVIPKPFRKIILPYGGPTMFVNEIPINEEALKTIKREIRGAKVYWAGKEWTSI